MKAVVEAWEESQRNLLRKVAEEAYLLFSVNQDVKILFITYNMSKADYSTSEQADKRGRKSRTEYEGYNFNVSALRCTCCRESSQ